MKARVIWIVLLVIVVGIQFVPSGLPMVVKENNNDLLLNNTVPDSVAVLLKAACYDCHSNESNYLWYSYVAPVSWLIARDVNLGKKELNFSNWESLKKMKKAQYLDEIYEAVSDRSMPMEIYPIMHPEAKLTKNHRALIADWAEGFAEELFK